MAGFCDKWTQSGEPADDAAFEALFLNSPPPVAEAARQAREADREGDEPAALEAYERITRWIEVNCRPEVAAPGATPENRRVATPFDGTPDGLRLCSAGAGFGDTSVDDEGGMVLYGESSRADPYDGPMLGLIWTRDSGHGGDGTQTRVRLRGVDAVSAPITVFQQTIVEELGTVVAWSEAGYDFGLYGRFWDASRTQELVAIAERMQSDGDRFRLPEAALPAGYRSVFDGSVRPLGLLFVPNATYEVRYATPGRSDEPGLLIVSGFVATQEEFDASRFLMLRLQRDTIGGRESLAGYAWSDEHPAIAMWREPDGLSVRIVGLGADLASAKRVAESARDLTRHEWNELAERSDASACERSP